MSQKWKRKGSQRSKRETEGRHVTPREATLQRANRKVLKQYANALTELAPQKTDQDNFIGCVCMLYLCMRASSHFKGESPCVCSMCVAGVQLVLSAAAAHAHGRLK